MLLVHGQLSKAADQFNLHIPDDDSYALLNIELRTYYKAFTDVLLFLSEGFVIDINRSRLHK